CFGRSTNSRSQLTENFMETSYCHLSLSKGEGRVRVVLSPEFKTPHLNPLPASGARRKGLTHRVAKNWFHANCLKNRRSFCETSRISGISNRIIASRSIPRPNA